MELLYAVIHWESFIQHLLHELRTVWTPLSSCMKQQVPRKFTELEPCESNLLSKVQSVLLSAYLVPLEHGGHAGVGGRVFAR
jgi:hypothetical protein